MPPPPSPSFEPVPPPTSRKLHIALWIAQVLIALGFGTGAVMKLGMPIAQLSGIFPWTGELPATAVRALGVVDLAGALGVLLPALTRIQPWLTVWAARGCAALQVCAIVFHASRGEWSGLPVNVVFLALAVFIAWGRQRRPIAPRGGAQPAAGVASSK